MKAAALAVDDDDTIRKLVVALLIRAGFAPVHSARDGVEAMQLLNTNAYSLVILDLRMPRLSGYEVLSRLASSPPVSLPKIIVLTADRTATIGSPYVSRMLTKPFDVDTFLVTVQACL